MNEPWWMNGTLKVAGGAIVFLVTLGAAWGKLGAIQSALKDLRIRVGNIEAILMRRK